MALRDNSLTKTNEQIFKASLIEMTKMLKMERRQQSLYQQPMRMYVAVLATDFPYDPIDNLYKLQPFSAPCKFIQMLDPIHTQMYIEKLSYNGLSNIDNNEIATLDLFLKSYTSQYNYNSVENTFWGRLPSNPTSIPIQSNTLGIPLADVNFTNNNILTFDARCNLYSNGVINPANTIITHTDQVWWLNFTLLFYRHTPEE